MEEEPHESGPKKEKGQRPAKPSNGIKHYGMRNGGTARTGIRCARCGKTITQVGEVTVETVCDNCGSDLHTCTNCAFFSTGARMECLKPITSRVAPKDARNQCTFFSPSVFVERTFEAGIAAAPEDARKAFDALFKK